MFRKILAQCSLVTTFSFTCPLFAIAQVVPDNTLGAESSTINSIDDLRSAIKGGAIRGDNLFHSFTEFSVGEGTRLDFVGTEGISNIFSRVTGGSISEIFGTLGVDGTANLFLMNPNGIIFGKNAVIDIGGSFIATTAKNIEFSDGSNFSSVKPDKLLLTIDFPVGLGMGSNSGEIKVQGSGHELRLSDTSNISNAFNSPIIGSQEIQSGLNTSSEQTLALIGSQVAFDGGILANPSGRIEVSSIESGTVGIDLSNERLIFNYSQTSGFQDIVLENRSLLDTSGAPGGNINVRGKELFLSENSLILNSNFSNEPSGNINIDMSGSVNLVGITSPSSFLSFSVIKPGIISQSLESGKGSDINISANKLNLSDFSLINTTTYNSGNAGNINIDVDNSITVIGISPIEGIPALSGVTSITAASGNGGNINLTGNRLFLKEGGLIISQALQQGKGGNINLNFLDSIDLSGAFTLDKSSESFFHSTIGTTTVFSEGGSIAIKTANLKLQEGARVNSTTSGSSKSGNININAKTLVQVTGKVPDSSENSLINRSQITASSEIPNPSIIKIFGLPPFPEGNAGSVIVNTPILEVLDEGIITVRNDGTGNAGNVIIDANSINLNEGKIFASTVLGEGGNIELDFLSLELSNQSQISASAGGAGNGGNVTIDANTIVGSGNSDITANALFGNGGNIDIESDVILGIRQSDRLTPQSDITADSELGIDGTININSPETSADDEVVLAPIRQEETPVEIVRNICSEGKFDRDNRLTITPFSSRDTTYRNLDYSDKYAIEVQQILQDGKSKKNILQPFDSSSSWQPGEPIIEPDAVAIASDGTLMLVATNQPQTITSSGLCQVEKNDKIDVGVLSP